MPDRTLATVFKNIADNRPSGMRPGLAAMLGAEINALLGTPNLMAVRDAAMAGALPGGVAALPAASGEPAGNLRFRFAAPAPCTPVFRCECPLLAGDARQAESGDAHLYPCKAVSIGG